MPDVYSVGPDELCDYELADVKKDDRYHWFVYWYQNGGYDGSGEAVGLHKETGLLHYINLGHCSCNGPMDDWVGDPAKMTLEEFLRPKDSIFDIDARREVQIKVRQLTGRWDLQ